MTTWRGTDDVWPSWCASERGLLPQSLPSVRKTARCSSIFLYIYIVVVSEPQRHRTFSPVSTCARITACVLHTGHACV